MTGLGGFLPVRFRIGNADTGHSGPGLRMRVTAQIFENHQVRNGPLTSTHQRKCLGPD